MPSSSTPAGSAMSQHLQSYRSQQNHTLNTKTMPISTAGDSTSFGGTPNASMNTLDVRMKFSQTAQSSYQAATMNHPHILR